MGEFSVEHERRHAIITYHLQFVDDGQHRGLFLNLLRNEPLEEWLARDVRWRGRSGIWVAMGRISRMRYFGNLAICLHTSTARVLDIDRESSRLLGVLVGVRGPGGVAQGAG